MAGVNEYGQPVGDDLVDWEPPDFPPATELSGRTVRLEPLAWQRHGQELFDVFSEATDSLWTYLPFGPFHRIDELEATIESMLGYPDWVPYAVVVDGEALGFASYLRVQQRDGVIEIGAIAFSPPLQNTTAATESLYMLIRNAFDLGYRRCEWKCDDLNAQSLSAGRRLGFRYEGTFRQATHYKGRNRDTAWLAITDTDWPRLDAALRAWLSPDNFDDSGHQIRSLGELTPGLST